MSQLTVARKTIVRVKRWFPFAPRWSSARIVDESTMHDLGTSTGVVGQDSGVGISTNTPTKRVWFRTTYLNGQAR